MKKLIIFLVILLSYYPSHGGEWTQQTSGTTYFLHDVFFLDANTGWVVGYNGTILKTTNAGENWITLSSGVTQELGRVFFVDANTGWVVGSNDYSDPIILKTTDGGNSWSSQNPNTTYGLSGLFFINDQVGWCSGYNGTIRKTTNGGQNWITQTPPGSGNSWFNDIKFYDENNGWICGASDKIHHTTNGGTNWIQQTSPSSNHWSGISIVDANTQYISGYITGKIIKTTNSGTNWTLIKNVSSDSYTSVSFVTQNQGWVTSANYNYILETDDGGITWNNQQTGTTNKMNCIFFVDANTGWAVGYNGTILKYGNLATITTSTINPSSYCPGTSIQVPFTISGTYNSGNIFTAQLSNSAGSFASPTNIGTLTSTSAGTINCTLPLGVTGTGFRIRVISSNPAVTGSNNGADITINPLPTPQIASGETTVCAESQKTYTSNTGTGITYKWEVMGGTISGADNNTSVNINWGAGTTGKVRLIHTTTAGCKDTVEQNVTIEPTPQPLIESGSLKVCEKMTYDYLANSGTNILYQWYVEKGVIVSGSTSRSVRIRWDSVGIVTAGKIKLIETNSIAGCKDSIENNSIEINPLPTSSIIGFDTVAVNRKDYYVAKDSVGLTSNWLIEGGTIQGNPVKHWVRVDWSQKGSGKLTLIQTNSTGCTDTAFILVTILDKPPLSIAVIDSACENGVNVYSTVAGNDYSLKWTCTQGIIQGVDTLSTVNIRWGNSGYGTLKLIRNVKQFNQYDSLTKIIKINALPNAEIMTDYDTVFAGSTAKYRAKEPGKYYYKWTATEGTIQGDDNKDTVVVKWSKIVLGQVSLTATDKVTGCDSTFEININVLQKPGLQIYGLKEICQNTNTEYKTAPVSNAINKWTVTGGDITTNKDTLINVLWTTSGIGKVKLVQEIPSLMMKDSTEISVKVNSLPHVTINDFPDICLKDTMYIVTKGTPDGGILYIDDKDTTRFNPINLGTGTHKIKYEFTDSLGCTNFAETEFNINPIPAQPTITENGNTLTASPGTKFQWYYQGKAIPGATAKDHIADTAGIYSVKAIDGIGCESALSDYHYYPLGGNGALLITDFERDFGLLDCEYQKYDTLNIQNYGKDVLNISNIEIIGKDSLNFILLSVLPPTTIDSKANKNFIILFKPKTAGEKSAQIVFTSNAVNDVKFKTDLKATKDSIGFELSENELKFEYVTKNTPQIKEITLTNTGSVPLIWTAPIKIDNDFRIISIEPLVTEPNGGKSKIQLLFNGQDDGYKTNTNYKFKENQCDREIELKLSAIVGDKPVDALAVIRVDSVIKIYRPGEIFKLPIFLDNSQNLDKVNISGFSADLVYNATLLVPANPNQMGSRNGDIRRIPLSLPVNPIIQPNILQEIEFIATLGNDTTTSLVLENLKSTGADSIHVTKIDGRFTLAGVCIEGGQPRLIDVSKIIALHLLRPNPTEDKLTIEYEIIESGRTEIYLVNSFGIRVKDILSSEGKVGSFAIETDLRDLSSGMYFIVLETPTVRKMEKVEVLR